MMSDDSFEMSFTALNKVVNNQEWIDDSKLTNSIYEQFMCKMLLSPKLGLKLRGIVNEDKEKF